MSEDPGVGVEGEAVAAGPRPGLYWTDNHCHLDPKFEKGAMITTFKYAAAAIDQAREAGVLRLINVGTSYNTSSIALQVAEEHRGVVWSTVGVHPHDARTAIGPGAVNRIGPFEAMIDRPEVVAVGECGLDYHYDNSPRDQQKKVFAAQIQLAANNDMALVIHSRDAWDDTFDILRFEGVPERTVFHCFTGGPSEAEIALELGCHLSFSGIVTFPSAPELREAAALCPLDRLLVETDSPYLAPIPHRGKPNRPAMVAIVGEAVAAARSADVAEVARATWDNATTLYQLPDGDYPGAEGAS